MVEVLWKVCPPLWAFLCYVGSFTQAKEGFFFLVSTPRRYVTGGVVYEDQKVG